MNPIAAVMIHVADVEEGLSWYGRAFPAARRCRLEAFDFEYLEFSGVRLEIVRVDEQVAAGAAGSVVYWLVTDFEAALLRLQGLGAKLHRGPMKIENGQRMCQVRDPWGNCIGLRGPSRPG